MVYGDVIRVWIPICYMVIWVTNLPYGTWSCRIWNTIWHMVIWITNLPYGIWYIVFFFKVHLCVFVVIIFLIIYSFLQVLSKKKKNIFAIEWYGSNYIYQNHKKWQKFKTCQVCFTLCLKFPWSEKSNFFAHSFSPSLSLFKIWWMP